MEIDLDVDAMNPFVSGRMTDVCIDSFGSSPTNSRRMVMWMESIILEKWNDIRRKRLKKESFSHYKCELIFHVIPFEEIKEDWNPCLATPRRQKLFDERAIWHLAHPFREIMAGKKSQATCENFAKDVKNYSPIRWWWKNGARYPCSWRTCTYTGELSY